MRLYPLDQGSPQWERMRVGRPTASQFDRIRTPTGKASSQSTKYMHELLAESVLGTQAEVFQSQWMNRGRHLEDEAVAYFEVHTDLTTDPGGFILHDTLDVGCSPDRLVYVTGDHSAPIAGLEIKCPSPTVHVGYLLNESGIADAYAHQIRGCMWVSGLNVWHTLSYHPDFPPALHTVEWDQAWADSFDPLIGGFLEKLDAGKQRLRDMGARLAIDTWENRQ